MFNIDKYIKEIESKSLSRSLERIRDSKRLSDDQKDKRSKAIVNLWLFGTKLLQVITFGLIKYPYNNWARKHQLKSRWGSFKGVKALRDLLSTGIEVESEIEMNSSVEEEAEYTDSQGTSTAKEPQNNESKKPEKETSTTEKSDEGNASKSEHITSTTDVSDEDVTSEFEDSSTTEELPQYDLSQLNSAAAEFLGNGNNKNDQRLFNVWYIPNTTAILMQMVPNWSRVIRVTFESTDDGCNTHEFVQQINHLIDMSKEYARPAMFVGKSQGADIHIIAGIYWNKKLLIIDPKGLYDTQELDAALSEVAVYTSSNVLQAKDDDYSCGPIITDIVMNMIAQFTPEQLKESLENLLDEEKSVDISSLLSADLVALTSDDKYEKRITQLRSKHFELLRDIGSTLKAKSFIARCDNAPAQVVFNRLFILCEQICDLGEAAEELADELGVETKTKYVKKDHKILRDYDVEDLPYLGGGCYGEVRAYRPDYGRIAVKLFQTNVVGGRSFQAESEVLKNLKHENVVRYLFSDQMTFNNKKQYCVLGLEYAVLGDLDSFICNTKRFPPSTVLKLSMAKDLTAGLRYLHDTAQIIYCDMKDENILVTFSNAKLILKYADFGLAVSFKQAQDIIHFNRTAGALLTMAPEVLAQNNRQLLLAPDVERFNNTTYSDVYSTGVVLWQIMCWNDLDDPRYRISGTRAEQVQSKNKFCQKMILGNRYESPEDIKNPEMAKLVAQMWTKRRWDRPSAAECDRRVEEEFNRVSSTN